jgi:WD40 repeat protein
LIGVKEAGIEAFETRTHTLILEAAWSEGGTSISGLEAVAFDSTGDYVAMSSTSGSVRVEQWEPGQLSPSEQLNHTVRLEEPKIPYAGKGPLRNPLAIAFDPTRRWLASIMSGTLSVYDLGAMRRAWETDLGDPGPAAALAFDPTGNLLAVGSLYGWQIWDVSNKKQLLDTRGVPVYALGFSPDGRLFAFGDARGTVHVWGTRN